MRLQVDKLKLSAKGRPILQGISLRLGRRSRVGIIGESGSGKTSFLDVLAGEGRFEGQVYWDEHDISKFHEKLIPGIPGVRYVHQNFALYPHLSVEENIKRDIRTLPDDQVEDKFTELERVFRLERIRDYPVINLSGGEKQRVALAKAMVTSFEVLLIDEPFSNQDYLHRNQMMDYILNVVSENDASLFIAAHQPEEIMSFCDYLLVMRDGTIVDEGPVEVLYQHAQNEYTYALLGEYQIIPPSINQAFGFTEERCAIRPASILDHRQGSSLECKARILESSFRGSHYRISFEWYGQTGIFYSRQSLEAGSEILLYLNKNDVTVFVS